jgi:hypothetical protein
VAREFQCADRKTAEIIPYCLRERPSRRLVRASFHRLLRLHQLRCTWDKRRFLCTLGRTFRQGNLQSVFQNGFSLHRDTSGSCHRQRCNNQGSSEWSYCTSNRLTDSVPIPLRGQYAVRSGVDAARTGRTMHCKPSQLIAF